MLKHLTTEEWSSASSEKGKSNYGVVEVDSDDDEPIERMKSISP